ncbi:hypothetical protein JW921_06005, partial [Candidatus Fermentibacterales bacterium]|nr:hypothetical protein [Candidatus Fermentibacterales bacterium]
QEDEQGREWMARYRYRNSQAFKEESRAALKAMRGEGLTEYGWAAKACVRPYRKPNCKVWQLGADGRCRGQEVCPDWKEHPKRGPRPPEPCEQPELFAGWEEE